MQNTLTTAVEVNSRRIAAYVSGHLEEFLAVLQDVVDLESHTYGDRQGEDRRGGYLQGGVFGFFF